MATEKLTGCDWIKHAEQVDIIGAGPSGLLLAWQLRENKCIEDKKITIYEKKSREEVGDTRKFVVIIRKEGFDAFSPASRQMLIEKMIKKGALFRFWKPETPGMTLEDIGIDQVIRWVTEETRLLQIRMDVLVNEVLKELVIEQGIKIEYVPDGYKYVPRKAPFDKTKWTFFANGAATQLMQSPNPMNEDKYWRTEHFKPVSWGMGVLFDLQHGKVSDAIRYPTETNSIQRQIEQGWIGIRSVRWFSDAKGDFKDYMGIKFKKEEYDALEDLVFGTFKSDPTQMDTLTKAPQFLQILVQDLLCEYWKTCNWIDLMHNYVAKLGQEHLEEVRIRINERESEILFSSKKKGASGYDTQKSNQRELGFNEFDCLNRVLLDNYDGLQIKEQTGVLEDTLYTYAMIAIGSETSYLDMHPERGMNCEQYSAAFATNQDIDLNQFRYWKFPISLHNAKKHAHYEQGTNEMLVAIGDASVGVHFTTAFGVASGAIQIYNILSEETHTESIASLEGMAKEIETKQEKHQKTVQKIMTKHVARFDKMNAEFTQKQPMARWWTKGAKELKHSIHSFNTYLLQEYLECEATVDCPCFTGIHGYPATLYFEYGEEFKTKFTAYQPKLGSGRGHIKCSDKTYSLLDSVEKPEFDFVDAKREIPERHASDDVEPDIPRPDVVDPVTAAPSTPRLDVVDPVTAAPSIPVAADARPVIPRAEIVRTAPLRPKKRADITNKADDFVNETMEALKKTTLSLDLKADSVSTSFGITGKIEQKFRMYAEKILDSTELQQLENEVKKTYNKLIVAKDFVVKIRKIGGSHRRLLANIEYEAVITYVVDALATDDPKQDSSEERRDTIQEIRSSDEPKAIKPKNTKATKNQIDSAVDDFNREYLQNHIPEDYKRGKQIGRKSQSNAVLDFLPTIGGIILLVVGSTALICCIFTVIMMVRNKYNKNREYSEDSSRALPPPHPRPIYGGHHHDYRSNVTNVRRRSPPDANRQSYYQSDGYGPNYNV